MTKRKARWDCWYSWYNIGQGPALKEFEHPDNIPLHLWSVRIIDEPDMVLMLLGHTGQGPASFRLYLRKESK